MGFEGSEHVSGLIIVSYDGFISGSILVDLAPLWCLIRLHRGVKGQLRAEDGDICLVVEGLGVYSSNDAGLDILVRTTLIFSAIGAIRRQQRKKGRVSPDGA